MRYDKRVFGGIKWRQVTGVKRSEDNLQWPKTKKLAPQETKFLIRSLINN